jgi:membrane protein required for colicin V production
VTTLDVILLAVVGAFAVRGLFRGFIREIVGLAGLVAGGLVAATYAAPAGEALVARDVVRPEYAPVTAGGGLFLATYLGVNLAGWLLDRLTRTMFLGPLMRVAGMIFAGFKGTLLVGLALLAGQRFAPSLLTAEQVDTSRLAMPAMALATMILEVGDAWLTPATDAARGVMS